MMKTYYFIIAMVLISSVAFATDNVSMNDTNGTTEGNISDDKVEIVKKWGASMYDNYKETCHTFSDVTGVEQEAISGILAFALIFVLAGKRIRKYLMILLVLVIVALIMGLI